MILQVDPTKVNDSQDVTCGWIRKNKIQQNHYGSEQYASSNSINESKLSKLLE